MLTIIYDWLNILKSGQEICAVFFEMKQAFDSLSHTPLLQNLQALGSITTFFRGLEADRQQCVVVGGETSNDIPVLSGVPQGSVLGPLLFLLYIDNITRVHLSTRSKLNLYADDILLVSSARDHHDIQNDVKTLKSGLKTTTYISIHTRQGKYMLVSRERRNSSPPFLYLGNETLEQVKMFKYLGVVYIQTFHGRPIIEKTCLNA